MGLIKSDLGIKMRSAFKFCHYQRLVTVPVPENELDLKNCDHVKACYYQINLAGSKSNVST